MLPLSQYLEGRPLDLNVLGSWLLLGLNTINPDWKIVVVQGLMTLASMWLAHSLKSRSRIPRKQKKPSPTKDENKSPDNGANPQ